MTKKTVYRTAIINKSRCITYVSELLFATKKLAIKRVKEMYGKEEGEPIETHRWEYVCINIINHATWYNFEKVINDKNQRYFGIIEETMIVDEI